MTKIETIRLQNRKLYKICITILREYVKLLNAVDESNHLDCEKIEKEIDEYVYKDAQ